ncbi:MAG: TetR family transcriptional regulator [Polyangiales bacterium]
MQTERHAARREQILGVTWRLIARDGLRAANMRSIAAAAGYANGALAYYFSSKEDLLRAAFSHVFERTERRIAEATHGMRGLAAMRVMCREILPQDEEKLLEARIVLPFWAEAAQDGACAELHARSLQVWRGKLRGHLREAIELGEVSPLGSRQAARVVEQLLTMLMGAQVMGVLVPTLHGPRMQHALVESVLASLS